MRSLILYVILSIFSICLNNMWLFTVFSIFFGSYWIIKIIAKLLVDTTSTNEIPLAKRQKELLLDILNYCEITGMINFTPHDIACFYPAKQISINNYNYLYNHGWLLRPMRGAYSLNNEKIKLYIKEIY